MIISRTPFRISFFGGGTDYPVWYRDHKGAVLATTINKYCYLTCRYLPPFFDHTCRIVYSKIELVTSIADIQHPSVRETLQFMQIQRGIELHHDGDLPARTGLGSSSAFSVALLHSLYGLKGIMQSKRQLAQEAIYVEQELLRENVGCQDQVLAACGGFQRVDFLPGEDACEFRLTPVITSRERVQEFQDHLLLYYTGTSRIASDIVREQMERTRTQENRRVLSQIAQMVDEAVRLFTGPAPIEEIGKLLHEGWLLKKGLSSKISTSQIDVLYEEARRAGALGGKLLGAGGGGFVLLFARPEDHGRIRERLRSFLHVPFRFENHGSQIVLYDPDSAAEERPAERPVSQVTLAATGLRE